jgi:hypothetical protein
MWGGGGMFQYLNPSLSLSTSRYMSWTMQSPFCHSFNYTLHNLPCPTIISCRNKILMIVSHLNLRKKFAFQYHYISLLLLHIRAILLLGEEIGEGNKSNRTRAHLAEPNREPTICTFSSLRFILLEQISLAPRLWSGLNLFPIWLHSSVLNSTTIWLVKGNRGAQSGNISQNNKYTILGLSNALNFVVPSSCFGSNPLILRGPTGVQRHVFSETICDQSREIIC